MKKTYRAPAKQNVEVATLLGIVSFIPSSSPDRLKKQNPARLTAGLSAISQAGKPFGLMIDD
jgi:hypothetical protein